MQWIWSFLSSVVKGNFQLFPSRASFCFPGSGYYSNGDKWRPPLTSHLHSLKMLPIVENKWSRPSPCFIPAPVSPVQDNFSHPPHPQGLPKPTLPDWLKFEGSSGGHLVHPPAWNKSKGSCSSCSSCSYHEEDVQGRRQ